MLVGLKDTIEARLAAHLVGSEIKYGQLTLVVKKESILEVAVFLRDHFQFEQLIDVAGIDYSAFGESDWETDAATSRGFSRGVELEKEQAEAPPSEGRFAVAYHLLSYAKNYRVRLKCFLDDNWPKIDSLVSVWSGANWFEREAFDLFGIIFKGHPDLRRILTDYGFIGHPFRKDFPLIGKAEVRYDAAQKRVIYCAVEIEPRVLVPRVIRQDNRYKA